MQPDSLEPLQKPASEETELRRHLLHSSVRRCEAAPEGAEASPQTAAHSALEGWQPGGCDSGEAPAAAGCTQSSICYSKAATGEPGASPQRAPISLLRGMQGVCARVPGAGAEAGVFRGVHRRAASF